MAKEIIIDGVNVSECGFFHPKYNDRDCHIALAFSDQYEGCIKCEQNPNCYFKQLKRKEQECEELKKREKYLYDFLTNKYNYGSFRPMWGAYLLKHFFNKDLGDFFDEKAYKMADTIEEKEKQLDQLKAENEELKKMLDNPEVRVALTDVKTGDREIWRKLGKKAENYKQALDEIEQTISNFPSKGIQDIPQTQIECTQYFLSVSETKLQKILDIIHKAKGE